MIGMSPSELVELTKRLSPEEQAELDKLLTQGLPLWLPQVGPQMRALESEADILFYGGQAGGGKTDLLLGLALTAQKHSILFRRQAVQLVGIEERMTTILGSRAGYNGQTGVWRLPGGRVLELGSVKEPGDWMKYQGRAHDAKCVGRGTMVKMADGHYKAIESIEVGDFVDTLEGPRLVTRTFTFKKPSVLATLRVAGEVIVQQVQSANHHLLSPSGWVCRDMTTDHGASSPTQPHCACKSEGLSSQTFAPTCAVLQAKCSGQEQQPTPSQDHAGCQSLLGSYAASGASNLESGFAAFVYRLSGAVRRFSANALQVLQQPFRAKLEQGYALPTPAHGANDVLSESLPAGYPGSYSSGPRHGGEQPQCAPTHGPTCFLLSGDVAQQTPSCFAGDGQGKTPIRSHRVESYSHPYTREKRRIEAEFLEASLEFLGIGEQELFDITVDDANHYITAGGLVNRNCFDEICHFTELQFRSLIGWMRTDDPSVRQRVVCSGNPPTDAEGEWVVRFWAPWIDPQHPNPAKDGELRWFVTDENGRDMEVPGPEQVAVDNEMMTPKSRTFIRSSVDDNLFLQTTGYKATLQSLPEPLRSQMLRGDFTAGRADHVWQLIPTDWVKAAQARWRPRDVKGQMTALGLDVSRGGQDKTSAARRHGQWFDEVLSVPGQVTDDGPKAAGFVAPLIRNGACVCVDAIGIGSSALDFIKGLNLLVLPVVGSEASQGYTVAGNLRFKNKRAEMYWRLREALDPTAEEPIAFPPDSELLTDLTAVRYKVVQMGSNAGIQIREKDEIREAIGRSPDKGDAVAMTFVSGIPAPGSNRRQVARREAPSWRV